MLPTAPSYVQAYLHMNGLTSMLELMDCQAKANTQNIQEEKQKKTTNYVGKQSLPSLFLNTSVEWLRFDNLVSFRCNEEHQRIKI